MDADSARVVDVIGIGHRKKRPDSLQRWRRIRVRIGDIQTSKFNVYETVEAWSPLVPTPPLRFIRYLNQVWTILCSAQLLAFILSLAFYGGIESQEVVFGGVVLF
jgi:hypothetical protein